MSEIERKVWIGWHPEHDTYRVMADAETTAYLRRMQLWSMDDYVPASQLEVAIAALRRIRDHGQTHDEPCWALHKGDCADAMQEIARAALSTTSGNNLSESESPEHDRNRPTEPNGS